MRFRLRGLLNERSEQNLSERVFLKTAFRVPLNADNESPGGCLFDSFDNAVGSRGNSLKIPSHPAGRLMMKAVHFDQILAGQSLEETAFA